MALLQTDEAQLLEAVVRGDAGEELVSEAGEQLETDDPQPVAAEQLPEHARGDASPDCVEDVHLLQMREH